MARMNIFSAQHLKFGTDLWDPSHRFETSWLLPPWVLFAIRATISLYAFVVTFFIIGWEMTDHNGLSAKDVRNSFSFFTILCYWGICFYFLISALHTFTYAFHGGTPLLNRLPRPLQALHYLFYSTITTFPFLVTIVYWGIIYSSIGPFKTPFALWSNVSQHGLNSAFAIFEIVFTRINPAPWIHLIYLILILGCYLGLAYVTHATKGYYVYNFLNPNPVNKIIGEDGKERNVGGVGKGAVVGYCFGIAIAIVIIFAVVKGLTTLRKWVTEKKMERKGRFYAGREMGYGDVELETQRVWEK